MNSIKLIIQKCFPLKPDVDTVALVKKNDNFAIQQADLYKEKTQEWIRNNPPLASSEIPTKSHAAKVATQAVRSLKTIRIDDRNFREILSHLIKIAEKDDTVCQKLSALFRATSLQISAEHKLKILDSLSCTFEDEGSS